jgi:hypothetical protein
MSNDTTFSAGTVITSNWLNGVNRIVNKDAISLRDPYFGVVANNSTDDTTAITAVFAAAVAAGQRRVHIPEGQYVLSDKITINSSIDITCDKTASFRWTNTDPTKVGFVFNWTDGSDTLCSVELPQLFGPGISSSFIIPGYSSAESYNYNLSSRYGAAVHIIGGDRNKVYVHYVKGFKDGILLVPTTTKTCDNYDITTGVMDFVENGLRVSNAGSGSLGVAQLKFKANTIWAKFPLYFELTNGYCVSSSFDIDGVFVNEDGGCVVYGEGTSVKGSTININWADAGKRNDSVPATPTNLRCPYLGGNQTSNSLSYDGMGTSSNIGYWGSNHCKIRIGAAFDYIGTDLGGGSPIPAAGHTIRIRDAGRNNDVQVSYATYETSLTNTPISTTTTIGETNYNGGVGGAQFARTVYCSATLSSLAAGSSQWHYVYHQCVSAAGFKPVVVAHKNEATIDNNLVIQAFMTGTTNREIKVRIKNDGSSSYTGTIFFWLVLP